MRSGLDATRKATADKKRPAYAPSPATIALTRSDAAVFARTTALTCEPNASGNRSAKERTAIPPML